MHGAGQCVMATLLGVPALEVDASQGGPYRVQGEYWHSPLSDSGSGWRVAGTAREGFQE